MISISMLIYFAFTCMSPAIADPSPQGVSTVVPVATVGYIDAETSQTETIQNPSAEGRHEGNVTADESSLMSGDEISETFSPSSSPDVTPTPSTEPTPDASASPDVTEQPSPTPSEAVAVSSPEAIQVRALYVQGPSTAGEGERIALKLVLNIQNASGRPLLPFGVHLDISSGESLSSASMTRSDSVTFRNGLLWVEDAVADSGTVTVEGDSLLCTVACVPFPAETDGKSITITLTLTDASGRAVELKDSNADGQMIQTTYTIRRPKSGDDPAENPEATEVPVNTQETTFQPEERASEENADQPQETLAPDESPINDPAGQEDMPSETVAPGTQPSSLDELDLLETAVPDEGTPNGEASPEPTVTVTPEPTPVARTLGIGSSIPYDQLQIGDTLVLTAEVTGYDGLDVALQWQQYADGTWENIQGATEATLTVSITEDNLQRAWRYSIAVNP